MRTIATHAELYKHTDYFLATIVFWLFVVCISGFVVYAIIDILKNDRG